MDIKRHLVTIEQAAVMLDCSAATIWRKIREGKLTPKHMLGRTMLETAQVAEMMQSKDKAQ